MKKLVIMFILLPAIFLTGCGNNSSDTKSLASQNSSKGINNNSSADFSDVKSKLDAYISNYLDKNSESAITPETRVVMGETSQGMHITEFIDKDGNKLRYELTYFGESGKKEKNYYIFDDGALFLNELTVIYDSSQFIEGTSVLKNNVNQFYYNNGKTYVYDDVNGNIAVSDKNHETDTTEKLSDIFENAEKDSV